MGNLSSSIAHRPDKLEPEARAKKRWGGGRRAACKLTVS